MIIITLFQYNVCREKMVLFSRYVKNNVNNLEKNKWDKAKV